MDQFLDQVIQFYKDALNVAVVKSKECERLDAYLSQLESKFMISRATTLKAFVLIYCLMTLFLGGNRVVTMIVNTIYAIDRSLSVIKTSQSDHGHRSMTDQLLSYWVVFALVETAESMLVGKFLNKCALYWLIKSMFLFYCWFPANETGAQRLVDNYLWPTVNMVTRPAKWYKAATEFSAYLTSAQSSANTLDKPKSKVK